MVGLLAAVHPALALRCREAGEGAEQQGRDGSLEHGTRVQRISCPLELKLR